MPALEIRKDRTPVMLRKLAKAEADARVARRLLAIANALDGVDRKAAAQAGGICAFTREDLVRICEKRFGKTMHPGSMGRLLQSMGLSRQKGACQPPEKRPGLAGGL